MRFVTDEIFSLIGKVVGSRFVMNRCSGIVLEIVSLFSYVNVSLVGIQRERNNDKEQEEQHMILPFLPI